jgi:hypothetical protein
MVNGTSNTSTAIATKAMKIIRLALQDHAFLGALTVKLFAQMKVGQRRVSILANAFLTSLRVFFILKMFFHYLIAITKSK